MRFFLQILVFTWIPWNTNPISMMGADAPIPLVVMNADAVEVELLHSLRLSPKGVPRRIKTVKNSNFENHTRPAVARSSCELLDLLRRSPREALRRGALQILVFMFFPPVKLPFIPAPPAFQITHYIYRENPFYTDDRIHVEMNQCDFF